MAFISGPSSPFEPPSLIYRVIWSPLHLALSFVHRVLTSARGSIIPHSESKIRLVCISDTHTNTIDLPHGDCLIHAGDLTNLGSISEIQAQIDWLASLDFEHVVFVAGNHDSYFDARSRLPGDKDSGSLDFKNIHYLQHSAITLKFPEQGRKLKLFGAPQIPACGGDEMAFQYDRGDDAWSGTVPDDIDVLVTHTPPRWHLDLPVGGGCEFLLQEVWRVRPKAHIFGHVHGGRGQEVVFWDEGQRLFESLCRRQGWWHMLGIWVWLDGLRLLCHDLLGILWTRIWGADIDATVMINAGVVDWRGKLSHGSQIIEL